MAGGVLTTVSEFDDCFNSPSLRSMGLVCQVDGERVWIGCAFRLMRDGDNRLVQCLLIQRRHHASFLRIESHLTVHGVDTHESDECRQKLLIELILSGFLVEPLEGPV